MVSSDVVMQTVKRMVDSGVDDNTIKMTLRGINLSEEQIQGILNKAHGVEQPTGSQRQVQVEEDLGEERNKEDEDDNLEEEVEEPFDGPSPADLRKRLEAASQEQVGYHTTTHAMLEGHAEEVDEVKRGVEELHRKMDSAPRLSSETIGSIGSLDKRISMLEKQVAETKANTIALQELLKKILETDRKTLLELQKKK